MGLNLLKLYRYCLYLLIYGVCFEYWDPLGVASTLSIAKLSTIPYFLVSIFNLKHYFRLSFLKKFLVPLIFVIVSGFFSAVVNDIYITNVIEILDVRMLQLIFLMFLIISHIHYDKEILNRILWVYIFGIFTMAFLYVLGAGVGYNGGRLFLFGENANITGMKTSLAFIIVFHHLLYRKPNIKKITLFFLLGLPILNLLIASGSRGALLSVFVGIFFMAMVGNLSFIKKASFLILGICLAVFVFQYILENDKGFMIRIMNSVQKGETAGRNHLWNSAYMIVKDNVFFGVGNPGLLPSMYVYSGYYQEPHNLFLEMWLTTGIIGFASFLFFLLNITLELFKDFKKNKDVLFCILLVIVLLNMSKSGGGAGLIYAWIFFGVIIGSTVISRQKETENELVKKL